MKLIKAIFSISNLIPCENTKEAIIICKISLVNGDKFFKSSIKPTINIKEDEIIIVKYKFGYCYPGNNCSKKN